MGWQTLYRRPHTTKRHPGHPVYSYLLKDLAITRRNQVWSMDTTYIPMQKGSLYLAAIIDLHTRYVVGWSISNAMSAQWTRQVIEHAHGEYGVPEIVNTDQGSQFISELFTHCFMNTAFVSAWTAKAELLITFTLSDFGEVSNMSIFISGLLVMAVSSITESSTIYTSTIPSVYISLSTIRHPNTHINKLYNECHSQTTVILYQTGPKNGEHHRLHQTSN